MKSSIYVKRQPFEVREFLVISIVLIGFCQPYILRNSAPDVTDIFATCISRSKHYALITNMPTWQTVEDQRVGNIALLALLTIRAAQIGIKKATRMISTSTRSNCHYKMGEIFS